MAAASIPWVEQALERDFNAALLDTLGALVLVIDRDGKIVRFNRACETLSGYTLAEVVDRPFWDILIPPSEVEGVEAVVRYLVDRCRPNTWENHWITKTGERRLIRWSNTVLCEGGRFAWIIGTGIDVTEQRRAEEERDTLLEEERAAREQSERAERRAIFLADSALFLHSTVGDEASMLGALARHTIPFLADWCIIHAGDDGFRRSVAAAFRDLETARRMAQIPPVATLFDESIGSLMPGYEPVAVNGRAACADRIDALCETLLPAQRERIRERLRIAGLSAYMAVPLLACGGRLLGAMFLASSSDARTYGPDDLLLAQALAARAALAVDNARLCRRLQQALEAREDFIIAASHELKTPLTSLLLAVEAMLSRVRAQGDPPWGAALFSAVQRSATRLAVLVEDMLDISRIEADAPIPAIQEVDLLALVIEAVDAAAEVLERARCAASVSSQGPTVGRWDRRWLMRAVAHLLANAAKYGAGRPIEVELCGSEETVQLAVRDHGIGIPAHEQARIFERFERATPVRHYGGLGLGLWLVRRMVEALGGEIRVESCAGEGATFHVALPRAGPYTPIAAA